ncbi:hypothetical protein [Natrialba aegyptia]|uniref:Uncharacterized protein n=1 Tax=Natrialba aegyptia DSM 13077 TaxID=1227491 RepID=M0AJR0_9EURY|nr:hypothetical protein [Natrialba aegyptia]ELY97633.1 hypothetical protein C480_21839 [Natrialba aegyptia DSM 13077]
MPSRTETVFDNRYLLRGRDEFTPLLSKQSPGQTNCHTGATTDTRSARSSMAELVLEKEDERRERSVG